MEATQASGKWVFIRTYRWTGTNIHSHTNRHTPRTHTHSERYACSSLGYCGFSFAGWGKCEVMLSNSWTVLYFLGVCIIFLFPLHYNPLLFLCHDEREAFANHNQAQWEIKRTRAAHLDQIRDLQGQCLGTSLSWLTLTRQWWGLTRFGKIHTFHAILK